MGKYRLLALVDAKLSLFDINEEGYVERIAERNELFAAMCLVEESGFTIISSEPLSPAMDKFYQHEAIRMLTTINPQILADDATRRVVIAEGYDYCTKLNPELASAYEELNRKAGEYRGATLIRAFFRMQHDLQQVGDD